MRSPLFENRIKRFALTIVAFVCAQLMFGVHPASAQAQVFKAAPSGEVGMEETTSQKDPKLTIKVLKRAFECVRQGRLDEVDRWISYALRDASPDPLFEAAQSTEFLAKIVAPPDASNTSAAVLNCDVLVLQACIQIRIGHSRDTLRTLRTVEKTCPTYHSINQVKSRIKALDLFLHPPARNDLPEPRELSAKELQEILDRIAREKVALSENQKTLDQALQEAKEEQLDKYSRWRASRYPLKVFVPADASCAKVPRYVAGDRNSLTSSFQIWQKTMKERIRFIFVDTAAKADITCEWVDHPEKLGTKAKDAVGTCQKETDETFAIHHARIRMLTVDTKADAFYGVGYRRKCLLNVALHEVGHALGLDHLPNEKSIMYFQVYFPLLDSLTKEDIGAMEAIADATQKEAANSAKVADAKSRVDAAKAKVASSSERIRKDESDIRHLVTNIDSQLKAAKDLERFHLWDQAFSFYDDAFKYRGSDNNLRQDICRAANYAGRAMLKKRDAAAAIKFLSRGRELMNKETPNELRLQLLENLRAAYEANNQLAEAAKVQADFENGNF